MRVDIGILFEECQGQGTIFRTSTKRFRKKSYLELASLGRGEEVMYLNAT